MIPGPTRRALLASLVAGTALADERSDVLEALAPFVTALTAGEVRAALRRLPPDQELRDNVAALMAQAEISSSVDLKRLESGRAEVDWLMNIRLRGNSAASERRRGTVAVEIRNGKIVGMGPAEFFRISKAAR